MGTQLKLILFVQALGFLLFTGCQQEVTEVEEGSPEQVFTTKSDLSSLIQRTSLRDGSVDNIVDGASCIAMKLPITVMVNNLEVKIDSEGDFEVVEYIVDKFDDDEDEVEIIFPITIILADHTEIVIENKEDLESLVVQCVEGEDDDDIECVDFKFPIIITVYDSENQVSDVVTIRNDRKLHKLIDELDDDDVASIQFPITVMLSDGSEMLIENNDALEQILENAKNECDEDDDNDHDDDDIDDSDLAKYLMEGSWKITYFFDGQDKTGDFDGYKFDFDDHYKVEVEKEDLKEEGKWYTNGNDGALEMEFEFMDEAPLNSLMGKWDVVEYDESIVKLSNGFSISVTIEICPDEPNDELLDIIMDGTWIVESFMRENTNMADLFDGIHFQFDEEDVLIAEQGEDRSEGKWKIFVADEQIKLMLEFEAPTLEELNEEWTVAEYSEAMISLMFEDGSYLIFARSPGDHEGIAGVIVEGKWQVAKHLRSNQDRTDDYKDVEFDFDSEGNVSASDGEKTVSGTWSVSEDNGEEKITLDFGDEPTFKFLNDEWDVLELNETRTEWQVQKGNSGKIDILIFEKI